LENGPADGTPMLLLHGFPDDRVGKIRPIVAEQITLEAIPKAWERLAEGHVRGKIVAKGQGT
jgi:NADPH:quinone reductase-like Zn-dependent oxidoreductase